MADRATRATDAELKRIEKRYKAVYEQAAKELGKKFDSFIKKWEKKNSAKRAQYESGQITKAEYQNWLTGQVFTGKLWNAKAKEAANAFTQANMQAASLVHEGRMQSFADNMNYISYNLEKDANLNLGFTIYDLDSVGKLIADDPKILPEWKVDKEKDYKWNYSKVNNAITQGIIQGESIPDITKRLTKVLETQNENKMRTFARTAMTGAQNAGRMEMMHRAKGMGIKMQKQWLATLDRRTRDAHQHLDGQIKEVDEPFESMLGDIMFPGDPDANPGNVYNCRCTLTYVYPDFEDLEGIGEDIPSYRYDNETGEEIEDMTYEEWTEYKQDQIGQRYGSGNKTFIQKDAYTESEKEAIHEYTTSSYSGVNSALRDGTVENYESVKRIVDEIDSAMGKTVVREGTVASRGASMADLSGMFEDKRRSWFEDPDNLKSLEGQTATFKSYISTTKGESVAEPYKRELQWHFTTEGKVHGIDAEQLASSSVKAEREILFDREALIEIEKVKVNIDSDGDIDGVVEIWAKIKENPEHKRRR